MRSSSSLAFALVTMLAACGNDTASNDPGVDSGPTTDAPDIQPPARGFQIQSSDIMINPGQEVTYCYYFRTPNTEPMAVKRWHSVMTPGSHHMIMFTTGNTDKMPPGTVSAANCGLNLGGGNTNPPVWVYAAQTPDASVDLPTDDGAGKPLAQVIPPNTAGFFQMHYLNASDQPIMVHVTLNAEALEASAAYTPTAAYITYDGSIAIPPNTNNYVNTRTCATPANAKFWTMSTHSHKQSIKTEVRSGASVAFSSTDWEHPGSQDWMTNPFYSFGNNQVTFECTYNNPTNRTITDGDSAATDEMCMATGYFFVPGATTLAPKFCYCISAQNCIAP